MLLLFFYNLNYMSMFRHITTNEIFSKATVSSS